MDQVVDRDIWQSENQSLALSNNELVRITDSGASDFIKGALKNVSLVEEENEKIAQEDTFFRVLDPKDTNLQKNQIVSQGQLELQNDMVGEDGEYAETEPATIRYEIPTAMAEPVLLGITRTPQNTAQNYAKIANM